LDRNEVSFVGYAPGMGEVGKLIKATFYIVIYIHTLWLAEYPPVGSHTEISSTYPEQETLFSVVQMEWILSQRAPVSRVSIVASDMHPLKIQRN
jgi:hypothetical protein